MDEYYPDPDSMYEERTHLADEDMVGYDEFYTDDYLYDQWDDDYAYQEDPL